MNLKRIKLAVVGLGYVGLPIAVAWSKTRIAPVLGFDISKKRIEELKKNFDRTGEVPEKELINSRIRFSDNPGDLKWANFIVAALPTPVDRWNRPDMSYLESASKIIGQNLRKGAIIVFESTVYPGATEEVCGPIIATYSGFKAGRDFKLAYSPERINPGDKKHTVDKIIKIISAQDEKALDVVKAVYGLICRGGLYKAKNIKTAEAAKVIENIQRDLNIALVNELSLIFAKMGLNTKEIIEAAATKWNFQYFEPGLVGGHCIGVDPYYLTYKAKELGHQPRVILAGRTINEYMPLRVAELTFEALKEAKKKIKGAKILVSGLTFKENVKDIRNSKIEKTIGELKNRGCQIFGYDPLLDNGEIERFEVVPVFNLAKIPDKFDAVIMAVIHNQFKDITLASLKKIMSRPPILIDIKNHFSNTLKSGFIYKSL